MLPKQKQFLKKFFADEAFLAKYFPSTENNPIELQPMIIEVSIPNVKVYAVKSVGIVYTPKLTGKMMDDAIKGFD